VGGGGGRAPGLSSNIGAQCDVIDGEPSFKVLPTTPVFKRGAQSRTGRAFTGTEG